LKETEFSVDKNGVALAIWNQPKKLNPLSGDQVSEVFFILEYCKRMDDIKVLVWTGAGKAFSSGASFGAAPTADQEVVLGYKNFGKGSMPPKNPADGKDDISAKGLVMAMMSFPKPSICAVNGICVGGSCNFALCLQDMCFASEKANFRYPFADLALTPEISSSYMMPWLVGMAKAKQWMMLGDVFDAQEAKSFGLVNDVFSPDDLLPKTLEVATRLAAKPPHNLAQMKRLMNDQIFKVLKLDEYTEEENRTINAGMAHPEGKKAMADFMAKFTQKPGATASKL